MTYIGSTGEQQIAEEMEHLDAFLFDVLTDPDQEYCGPVPAEPDLDLTKPVEHVPDAPDSIVVNIGGNKTATLTIGYVTGSKSKSQLRKIIAFVVVTKPQNKAHAKGLHMYLNLAVDRLNELTQEG